MTDAPPPAHVDFGTFVLSLGSSALVHLGEIQHPETAESKAMSKDLKQRGFRFVGPTIVYSHMQATGMVNDHLVGCFRHREVARMR